MIAFEISELDVQRAVEEGFDLFIDDDTALRVLSLLDRKEVSDAAYFQSDSDGGNDSDDDMNAATNRAEKNIILQIDREKSKFIFLF